MSEIMRRFLEMFQLEREEEDAFRGWSPDYARKRLYGGQILGQAVAAAGRTAEGAWLNSFHGYFLNSGYSGRSVGYRVKRLRDGRSIASRSVTATQGDRLLFTMNASFHRGGGDPEAPSHQLHRPEVAGPEGLRDLMEFRGDAYAKSGAPHRKAMKRKWAFDLRPVEPQHYVSPPKKAPLRNMWVRLKERVPENNPVLTQALLAYISDLVLEVSLFPHGISLYDPALSIASLDHAMWFHRRFTLGDWLLYVQESPVTHGGRAMVRAAFYTADGTLVASVAQEGMIRIRAAGKGGENGGARFRGAGGGKARDGRGGAPGCLRRARGRP